MPIATPYQGIYKKRGRPPKNWKPPYVPILKIKKGKVIIFFK